MINIVKPSVSRATDNDLIGDMELIEYCGRICHRSEDKAKLGSYNKFIRKFAQRMGHESILEHVSVSYEIVCDRATSHQIVRHRLAAYSQESQRYCGYNDKLDVIAPPSIGDLRGITKIPFTMKRGVIWIADEFFDPLIVFDTAEVYWLNSVCMAYHSYRDLLSHNIPPEDARSVLPNCTATTLVMTCNLRNWRHIIKERAFNKNAQWQIKKIFTDIFMELVELYPCVFDDLQEVANGV